MCFTAALLFASAYAGSAKKDSDAKAVPLEKKLDKRGLLNLGYGYGINGLDVGYLGNSHLGGLHSGLGAHGLGYSDLSLGGYHGLSGGYGGHGLSVGYGGHGLGHHGLLLGGHTDVVKTHTLFKGVPVPVVHEKHIPGNCIIIAISCDSAIIC